jgi:type IV secretory pathway TrbL component
LVISHAADSVHTLSDDTGIASYITLKITLAIIQVVLFIVLSFIAFCLIKVLLQTYFLLYIGFILTGFVGSSWTMNYWQRYLQAISAMAVKFLVMCVLVGVLANQAVLWSELINQAGMNIIKLSGAILNILGSSIILALLIYQLPDWMASALAGEVRLNLGDKMSAMAQFLSGSGIKQITIPQAPYKSRINNAVSPRQTTTSNTPINTKINNAAMSTITSAFKK